MQRLDISNPTSTAQPHNDAANTPATNTAVLRFITDMGRVRKFAIRWKLETYELKKRS